MWFELVFRGAGDGNLTRTISLGIRQIGASDRANLGSRCTASDRQGPCGTGVNGPPMARGLIALEGRPPSGWLPQLPFDGALEVLTPDLSVNGSPADKITEGVSPRWWWSYRLACDIEGSATASHPE